MMKRGTITNLTAWTKRVLCTAALGVLVIGAQPFIAQADLKTSIQDQQAKKAQLQQSIQVSSQQKAAQQQAATKLKTEIDQLNGSLTSTQKILDTLAADIVSERNSIVDLANQIDDQQKVIATKQSDLEAAVKTMYIDAQSSSTLSFFQGNTISESFANQQSYQAVEQAVKQSIDDISVLKADLEKKKTQHLAAQSGLQEKQNQQAEQKKSLESQQSLKNKLLSDTAASISQIDSTISQYQDQIRAADGKITQFLSELKLQAGYAVASGDLIVANSQPWHYFQTDTRWGSQPLDPSSAYSDSFAESGCLITSITEILNRYGVSKTPPQVLSAISAGGGMYGDLFAWDGVKQASGGKLDLVAGKERISWGVIDASIALGMPVIVHVSPNQSSSFGHWVVISSKTSNGTYAVEDPYFQTGRIYPSSWIDFMARIQPI